jgi:hypothetical protein
VFARLQIGLTMCRLARTAKDEKLTRYLNQASKALEDANDIMWKLDMSHPDFDQLTAQCERLKFELDNLRSE